MNDEIIDYSNNFLEDSLFLQFNFSILLIHFFNFNNLYQFYRMWILMHHIKSVILIYSLYRENDYDLFELKIVMISIVILSFFWFLVHL